MERIQNLVIELEELLVERNEIQNLFIAETEWGNAHEADRHAEDLSQSNREIEILKTRIIGWVEAA